MKDYLAEINKTNLKIFKLEKPGLPLPGTQIKIYNPDENGIGEICMRGRNVFMGYLNNL